TTNLQAETVAVAVVAPGQAQAAEASSRKVLQPKIIPASSALVPDELTLQEAEQIAIKNNPHIHVGQLLARAQHQVYRETRSAYLPQLEGGAVGAKANSGSRFTVDGLRSTRLLTHAGGGVMLNQLIFDFGRTTNLMASSRLQEKAQNAKAMANRLDVVLITDQAFYGALEAQALVRLAQQTVDTRDTTNRQITELTKNKLRSDIDLAISDENIAQARLLLLDAQTQKETAMNALIAVLGFDQPLHCRLVDRSADVTPPPGADVLVKLALEQRPDLMALNYTQQAAKKYSRAQREQMLPTISTNGVVGVTPVRTDQYFTSNWFGAVALNLKVPIFNGFLYSAEAGEAEERAGAAKENLRDLRNRVVRDVRDASLQTHTSYEKIAATEKFLDAANLGLKLAQARYKLGLSSIVELSQAQLAETQASIENVNARFEYELSLAALNYQLGNLP
ncbi:MAG: TolC family protein, partial [Acidobacteriaceae bacterium]